MMMAGSVSPDRLDEYREDGGGAPSLHSPLFFPDIEPTITTGVTGLTGAALELLQGEK
jgi:hippurate hydrolase